METGYLSNGHLDRLTAARDGRRVLTARTGREQAQRPASAADTAIREIRRAVGPAAWFVGLYRGRLTTASGRRLGDRSPCGRSRAERSHEPLPVLLELTDLGLHARRDVVDRDEERHLPVAEGVDHLAVAPADLEDRLSVGHELHLGEVLGQTRPSS